MTSIKKSKISKSNIPEKLFEDTISNDMSYEAPSENIHSLPYAWDNKEDSMLCNLVYQYGTGNWELIAQNLGSKKTPIQCLHRWNSIMKPALVKGPWNVEEDKKLIDWIKTNGASKNVPEFSNTAKSQPDPFEIGVEKESKMLPGVFPDRISLADKSPSEVNKPSAGPNEFDCNSSSLPDEVGAKSDTLVAQATIFGSSQRIPRF